MNLLSLKNISKAFGNEKEGTKRKVLENLSLSMQKGESLAILGPSGSGKTTLLNIIGAMEEPDEGIVRFGDQNLGEMNGNELVGFRNRQIGFIFQFHHLLPQCTVLENVLIPTLPLKGKDIKDKKREEAEHLLKKVGIYDHRNKIPSKLSGGECQRVAVVRAMINQPSLLLADEPTGSLDEKNADKIADLLLELNQENMLSLLVVTHSEKLASAMNRTLRLRDGKFSKI